VFFFGGGDFHIRIITVKLVGRQILSSNSAGVAYIDLALRLCVDLRWNLWLVEVEPLLPSGRVFILRRLR